MKTPPSPRVSPSRGNGAPAVRWKPGQSGEVVAFPFALKSARAAPGLQIAWKSPMPDAANTDERGGIERSLVRDISLRNLGRNIERMLAQKGQWPHNDQPNGRCRK